MRIQSLAAPTPAAWETIADIATAIGVLVALAAVVVSLILTLRSERLTRLGQDQEREMAESSASRAEAAAALTEEYTRRVVDALETMATKGIPTVEGRPVGVRWSIEHHVGDTYRVTNEGNAVAMHVEVSSHPTLRLMNVIGGPDLKPGEALTFMAARSLGTKDSTVTVRWLDEDGVSQEWKYPLPGRPPR